MHPELSNEEIAALIACSQCGKGAELPFIRKKFADEYKPFAKEALEKLARRPERLISRVGGRKDFFSITKAGLRWLKEFFEQGYTIS